MTKVLYNRELAPQFMKYGILIPIKAERSLSVFNSIKDVAQINEYPLENIPVLDKSDLLLAHSSEFVENFLDEKGSLAELIQTYELVDKQGVFCRYNPDIAQEPLSNMVFKVRRQAGATYQAMTYGLKNGFCFFLGGGMHHAMKEGGRGFCPINDLIIGLRKLQKDNKIKTAWVIDVDAHMGDGCAEIAKDDESITTLSIHMAKGWPLDGENNSNDKFSIHPSDIDIPINNNEEHLYLEKLEQGLNQLSKQYAVPDIVLVVNGSDPYEKDELPGTRFLNLTKEQMLERDLLVYHFLKKLNTNQTWVMSGGYGPYSYEIYAQFITHLFENNLID